MPEVISALEYCRGCGWAKYVGNGVFCPFVVGSCARVPGTIDDPDAGKVATRPMRRCGGVNQVDAVLPRPKDRSWAELHKLNGEWRTLKDWANIYGMDLERLRHRMQRGWDLERALTQEVIRRNTGGTKSEQGNFDRESGSGSGAQNDE